ncbi:unnamed protein product, partial [Prorocentrum cordatum]
RWEGAARVIAGAPLPPGSRGGCTAAPRPPRRGAGCGGAGERRGAGAVGVDELASWRDDGRGCGSQASWQYQQERAQRCAPAGAAPDCEEPPEAAAQGPGGAVSPLRSGAEAARAPVVGPPGDPAAEAAAEACARCDLGLPPGERDDPVVVLEALSAACLSLRAAAARREAAAAESLAEMRGRLAGAEARAAQLRQA